MHPAEQLAQDIGEILPSVRRLQEYYRLCFVHPNAEPVLTDLAVFCHYSVPFEQSDPIRLARLEGRREVFLRIRENIDLSDVELARLIIQTRRRRIAA